MSEHFNTQGRQTTNPHALRQLRNRLSAQRGAPVTQEDFAAELGVSTALINAIESSRSRSISVDLAYRILFAYGEWAHPTVTISEVIATLKTALEKAIMADNTTQSEEAA